MEKTYFALYRNLTRAYDAAQDLRHNGFEPSHVSFFASDHSQQGPAGLYGAIAHRRDFSALLGGVIDLLLTSGFMTIPGIGRILAVGSLEATISGAGVGALIGYLTAALIDAPSFENQSRTYANGIRPGNTLITIRLSSKDIDDAVSILARYCPIAIRYSNHESDVEHYEIAGYGAVRTDARLLGDSEAVKLLEQPLNEETEPDKKLTQLAEQGINTKAEAGRASQQRTIFRP